MKAGAWIRPRSKHKVAKGADPLVFFLRFSEKWFRRTEVNPKDVLNWSNCYGGPGDIEYQRILPLCLI